MRLNLNVAGHVPRHWYLVSAGIQYANGMQHEVIQQQDVIGTKDRTACWGKKEQDAEKWKRETGAKLLQGIEGFNAV